MLQIEATAPNKFKFDTAGIEMEFDAAKNQMTLKQRGQAFVFTKEK
jgi:D-alanyl-D-alanine carboxypeptidase